MTSSTLRFDHLQHQFEENPRRHFVPLANAFLQAGNAHRAVELCRTFLPQLPGHVSGHVVLAEALRTLGAADEAREEYERVLALDAENIVAVRALGDLAAARGNAAEARGWYARLVELEPRDADAAARLEELSRAAAAPGAPLERAVAIEDLDARPPAPEPEAVAEEAAPLAPTDQELAEEFTAGFFASVLDERPRPSPADDDDARFATDLDHLLPGEALPGADELHATLSASPHGESRSVSSVSPFDLDAPALGSDPPAPEPAAFGPPAFVDDEDFAPLGEPVPARDESARSASDAPRATPVGSPLMEEFPEDAAAAADLGAEPGPAFVTETMAELYLRQGFRAEALDVYRQLLAASPGDERLQAVVADLSRPAAPTPDAPLPAVESPVAEVSAVEPSADDAPAARDAEHHVSFEDVPPLELVEHRDAEPGAVAAEPVAACAEAEPPAAADASAPPFDDAAEVAPTEIEEDGPQRTQATDLALGSGGMVEGVAGVEDRTWGLAEPTPAAPTVASWLSSLVAGEELAVASDDRAEPAQTPAHDEAPAQVVDAIETDEESESRDEPWIVADEAQAHDEPPVFVDEAADRPAPDLETVAWEPPSDSADLATADETPAHDEPAVAWIEAEPEELAAETVESAGDASSDLATAAPEEAAADAQTFGEFAIETAASDEPEPAMAPADDAVPVAGAEEPSSGWPGWGADAFLAEPEPAASPAGEPHDGWGDAGGRDEAEFAGTIAAEPPMDDLAPLAPSAAGVAPAGDAPLRDDEIEGPATTATGATWDDPFAWDEPGESPAAPAAAAPAAAEPFSLDELFARPASPADESAADTLAAAAAGIGDDDASRRHEATAAGDAASLGALLRATPPGVPAPGAAGTETPARGTSFSFEQFFRPTPAAGGPAAPPPPRPAPEPAPERDDDLDEFHRWLEGLSKS